MNEPTLAERMLGRLGVHCIEGIPLEQCSLLRLRLEMTRLVDIKHDANMTKQPFTDEERLKLVRSLITQKHHIELAEKRARLMRARMLKQNEILNPPKPEKQRKVIDW